MSGPGPYQSGSTNSAANTPTFSYDPSKGDGLKLSDIKDVYDSAQADSNTSLDTLSNLAGVNKLVDIGFEDFDGHEMTAYGPFNHSGTCGGTQNLTHYRSKSINGVGYGFYYSSPNNGRINFLPNGVIYQGTNKITIQNGHAISNQLCTPAGSS